MPLVASSESRIIKRRPVANDWWQASGTIPDANIKEHVENPTAGQVYAGGAITAAWSVSFRTTLASLANGDAFDTQVGRVNIRIMTGTNGMQIGGSLYDISLFATGDHTYMLVSDGASVQAYRDNVAIGAAVSSTIDIANGGATRWRSNYAGASVNPWSAAIRAGHIANIGLDSTQRAALHTSMMSLA